ncbi:MAG TPA: hypothetical protein V6C96_03920, partial [Vampirovibrionales bacterium]
MSNPSDKPADEFNNPHGNLNLDKPKEDNSQSKERIEGLIRSEEELIVPLSELLKEEAQTGLISQHLEGLT